eukprot:gene32304-30457_t
MSQKSLSRSGSAASPAAGKSPMQRGRIVRVLRGGARKPPSAPPPGDPPEYTHHDPPEHGRIGGGGTPE